MRSWITVAALVAVFVHGDLSAEERLRIGRAYDAQTGVLLYEARHVETLANGRVVSDHVRYLDPNGRTIAEKQVDFRGHPYTPEFRLDNDRTGHMEALLREDGGEIEVRFRERADQELRQIRLDAPTDAVADAGFDRLIESNWEKLSAGERLTRRFLIPSRLEFMDFRIGRAADPDDGDADPDTVRFALEADSVLVRLFAPTISMLYDRESRRMLRYEGPSNLRDESGDNHVVRIEFEYPTLSARAPQNDGVTQSRFMASSKER